MKNNFLSQGRGFEGYLLASNIIKERKWKCGSIKAHRVEQSGRLAGIVALDAYGHCTGMTLGLAYKRNF